MSYIYSMTDTWTGGAVFTAVKMNVTDTSSDPTSLLMDLQIGGATKFNVGKGGNLTLGNGPVFNANYGGAGRLGLTVDAGGIYTFLSTGTILPLGNILQWDSGSGSDVYIGRAAAATLQLGNSDAATATAQTFQVQSVAGGAGHTDVAGADWTIKGSASTGAGTGGAIIFQTTMAGASGASQNSYNVGLRINQDWSIAGFGSNWSITRFGTFTGNGVSLGANSTITINSNSVLTAPASAAWQLGAADAASPVAQTIQVQSATGSNTSAVNWTMQGSLSTGTGTAGTQILSQSFSGVTASGVSVTCSNGSPCTVTLNAHGFAPGQPFQFGGSAAPGGLALNTTYYVLSTSLALNTFTFATTLANWQAGTQANSSSTGTSVTLTTQASVQNPASTLATWGPSGLTGSQATSMLNLAQTWNTSGNPIALVVNATNIASGATSKLIDLQTGGSTQFNVSKTGAATAQADAVIHGVTVGQGLGSVSSNTAVGSAALSTNTTGAANTAVGLNALVTNTVGVRNVAIGANALQALTTGNDNVAVGGHGTAASAALGSITTGVNNTAVGSLSLAAAVSTVGNTAVGYSSLNAANTGDYNVAVGLNAIKTNTVGTRNVGIGANALQALTTGNDNVAIGGHGTATSAALGSVTTGVNNTAVGSLALSKVVSTVGNTAVGYSALTTATTGDYNVAIGLNALVSGTVGTRNIAIGANALVALTTGTDNVAIGGHGTAASAAGAALTTGVNNTAVGSQSLKAAVSTIGNTAIGFSALNATNTGDFNTAVGLNTAKTQTVGLRNTAIGANALQALTTGTDCTAVGGHGTGTSAPLGSATTAVQCTAVGVLALAGLTTGSGCTSIGYNAGVACTSGTNNTYVGLSAGSTHATGSNSTYLGNGALATATSTSNEVCIGNASVTAIKAQVTTITGYSDMRDKTDVEEVTAGLAFIAKLKPKTFRWDQRFNYSDHQPDGTFKEQQRHIGFLAQEVKEAADAVGLGDVGIYDDADDGSGGLGYPRMAIATGYMIPALVKAVQELAAKNAELEARLKSR
jgi:hypothetical protein